jgi:tetratricopeptide (TPR) repeat protein
MMETEAGELMRLRRYRDAAAALAGRTEREELVPLGYALGELGRYEEAFSTLRQAIGQDRTDAGTRYHLAQLYASRQRHDWTIKHLHRALRDAPEAFRPRVNGTLACAYAALGRSGQAARALERASLVSGDDPTRSFLAVCSSYVQTMSADYDGALEQLQRAIDLTPDEPGVQYQLAQVYAHRGDADGAAVCLSTAIERDPERLVGRLAFADTLMALERWEAAAAELRAGASLGPDSEVYEALHMLLGDCAYQQGLIEAAIASYAESARYSKRQPSLGQRFVEKLRRDAEGRRVWLRSVPRLHQKGNWCGPCCLAMVMNAWGDLVTQDEVAPASLGEGLTLTEMIEKARERGYAAEMRFGDLSLLQRCLDAGLPTITALSDASMGHYHVIIGYDEAKGVLIIQDTNARRPSQVPMEAYLKPWGNCGRWMAIIVPREQEGLLRDLGDEDRLVISLLRDFEQAKGGEALGAMASRILSERDLCLSSAVLARYAGFALLNGCKEQEVLAWLDEAAGRYPDQSWVSSLRAAALMQEGKVDEAIPAALTSLEKDRSNWAARLTLSQAYEKQQHGWTALRQARMAVRTGSRRAQTYGALARLLVFREKWQAAADAYETAVELAPSVGGLLVSLMQVYTRLGRMEEAESLLPRAEQLADKDLITWAGLGQTYGSLQRLGDAARCFERALALEPDHLEIRIDLAQVCLARREIERAITELERVTEQASEHVGAWFGLAQAYGAAERQEDAIQALRQVIELQPNGWRAWGALGQSLAVRNDLEEARGCFEKVTELAPDFPPGWVDLGAIREQSGDAAGAAFAFERAVALDPDSPAAQLGLGRVLWLNERPEEAVTPLQRAAELAPESPHVQENLGRLYVRLARWEEAQQPLMRALQLAPHSGEIAEYLVTVHRKLERWPGKQRELRERWEGGNAEVWEVALYAVGGYLDNHWDHAYAAAKQWLAQCGDAPGAYWPHWLVLALQIELGEIAAAVQTGREAVTRIPDQPYLRAYYGLALGHRGDFSAAVEQLLPVLEATRGDTRVPWETALFMIADGRTKEGKDLVRRVKEWAPRHPFAEALLAYLEGDHRRGVQLTDPLISRLNDQRVAEKERCQFLRALLLERAGLLYRPKAMMAWARLAGGRTGFAKLAHQRWWRQSERDRR